MNICDRLPPHADRQRPRFEPETVTVRNLQPEVEAEPPRFEPETVTARNLEPEVNRGEEMVHRFESEGDP